MIAHQQRLVFLAMLLIGIAWGLYVVYAERAEFYWLALATPAVVLGLALLLEYTLLIVVDLHQRQQPPPIGHLIRAWLGEMRASPLVFLWTQPFRSHRWPDQLPSQIREQTGVLLVHGFACNRGVWTPWIKHLTRNHVPFVALSLEPPFASIDTYSAQIEEQVARLRSLTGKAPVVVAHSMGGLAVRAWRLKSHISSAKPDAESPAHLLTLGTPHHGTWLARFGIGKNTQEMRLSSPWITNLARREPRSLRERTTCFYSACDNVVFPRSVAMLEGANNVELLAVAHVAMVYHPEPLRHLMDMLLKLDASAQ